MAKITDYSDIPELVAGDKLLGVDVSDTTDDPAGSTFAVPVSVLDAKYAPSVLDEDDFASDSATEPPSQQSTRVWAETVLSPQTALRLSGSSGEFVSAPDSATASVVGDLCLVADITLDDWTPAASMAMSSKYATGQRSWNFILLSTGAPSLTLSIDGTATATQNCSDTSLGSLTAGTRRQVAVTVDVDDGASNRVFRFWVSDNNGATWTQLGSTNTVSGVYSIFDSTAAVAVGAQSNGTSNLFSGDIHSVSVRSGIGASGMVGGTEVARFDGRAPATPQTDGYDNTWTVNGSGWSWVFPT